MGLKTEVPKTVLAAAASLLIALEGLSFEPYLDSAKVWTDCYGNTKGVVPTQVRTQAECDALLGTEVHRIGTMMLKDVPNIPAPVLVSGISFVYNVGDGAYRSSTYRKELKAGRWESACSQMKRWVYITVLGIKKVLRGLQNRREKEFNVCVTGL